MNIEQKKQYIRDNLTPQLLIKFATILGMNFKNNISDLDSALTLLALNNLVYNNFLNTTQINSVYEGLKILIDDKTESF